MWPLVVVRTPLTCAHVPLAHAAPCVLHWHVCAVQGVDPLPFRSAGVDASVLLDLTRDALTTVLHLDAVQATKVRDRPRDVPRCLAKAIPCDLGGEVQGRRAVMQRQAFLRAAWPAVPLCHAPSP